MESRDVLADDVELSGPALLVSLRRKSGCGEVVRERVEPDVGRLCLAGGQRSGEWDAPRQSRATGGDVLEPLVDHRDDLVPSGVRLQEIGSVGVQPLQKVAVLA